MWEVVYHTDAEAERNKLPKRERTAVAHVVEKLEALGPDLPFPHQSAVRGGKSSVRELRPRGVRGAPGAHFTAASATCLLFSLSARRQRATAGVLVGLFRRRKSGSERC